MDGNHYSRTVPIDGKEVYLSIESSFWGPPYDVYMVEIYKRSMYQWLTYACTVILYVAFVAALIFFKKVSTPIGEPAFTPAGIFFFAFFSLVCGAFILFLVAAMVEGERVVKTQISELRIIALSLIEHPDQTKVIHAVHEYAHQKRFNSELRNKARDTLNEYSKESIAYREEKAT